MNGVRKRGLVDSVKSLFSAAIADVSKTSRLQIQEGGKRGIINGSKLEVAERFVRKSAQLEKGPPSIYLLPLTPRNLKNQIRWFDIGSSQAKVEHKTILLVGFSKSGKSTLVNAMANYILGISWDSPYRFSITEKEETTSSIVVYTFHHEEGFAVPFSLTVVDTPGNMRIKAFQEFLLNSETKIDTFHALYFVSKPDKILSDDDVRFLNSLCSILSTESQENCLHLLVTSYTRNTSPPITKYCQRIPVTKDSRSQVQLSIFSNCWLWMSKAGSSTSGKRHWEISHLNFQKMFQKLEQLPEQKLEQIRDRIRPLTIPTSPNKLTSSPTAIRREVIKVQCGIGEFAYNCTECKKTCTVLKGQQNRSLQNLTKITCPDCSCASDRHCLETFRWVINARHRSGGPIWEQTANKIHHGYAERARHTGPPRQ